MKRYRGLASQYRPQKFSEVFEQTTAVITLKNAIQMNHIGHAYLFCGMRGTGKTTLARLLAKAINCNHLLPDQEPCNTCSSCIEITSGHSLDVIEIDGASNRGIDDIRNLNETVNYAASNGKYKIYIIDEVHMLTKEAFNALLKTLEEPPQHVIFCFATTEPHKIPPTIISRCQRFDLKPIPSQKMVEKLKNILNDLNLEGDLLALQQIASHAEGSLRDAESLLDQLLCFQEGSIQAKSVKKMLGTPPLTLFFALDTAAFKYDLTFPFEMSRQIFNEGYHIKFFLEHLISHYRNILLIQLGKKEALPLFLSQEEKETYEKKSTYYTKEQVLEMMTLISSECDHIQKSPFQRIDLEILLLRLLRLMKKMSLDQLVEELVNLKTLVCSSNETKSSSTSEEKTLPISPFKEAPFPSSSEKTLPSSESVYEMDKKLKKRIKHDQILYFAAVELNGSIKKG